MSGLSKAIVAAIDIGTNSVHMVIAEIDHLGFHILTTEKEVVRLGAGVKGFDHLEDSAIERGLSALRRMKNIAHAHSAVIRTVATSAVREADNGEDFVRRVKDEVGIEVAVITGAEEARLIALGVQHSLSLGNEKVLMIDIGGGSTEFTVARGSKTLVSQSLKLGAVRLTDKFFGSGTSSADFQKARAFVSSTLAPLANDIRTVGFQRVVVSSGTCETIVRAALLQQGKEFGATLNAQSIDRADVENVLNAIAACKTTEGIMAIPGIDAKRAEIISAGSLILHEICRQLKVNKLEYSDFALREGVLIDAMEQILSSPSSKRNAARDGVLRFAQRCSVEIQHAEHVARLSIEMFRSLSRKFELDDRLLPLLESAALLANVGTSVSYSKHHLHSYYMIRHSELVGFTANEIELIALTARYHRKGSPKKSHEEYALLSQSDQEAVDLMAGILRIATGLDRSHDQCVIGVGTSLRETDGKDQVIFNLKSQCDNRELLELNLYTAQERTDLLERYLGCRVILRAA